jgi:hypothetical protein
VNQTTPSLFQQFRATLNTRRFMIQTMMVLAFILSAMPVAAQDPSIELDLTPTIEAFFSSIGTFLPVFAPIIALGVGISVSLALLAFLGKQMLNAFKGGGK